MRGGRRRRAGRAARARLRQAHRFRVPASRTRLGRVLPAQGHPSAPAHRRRGRVRLLAAGGRHRVERAAARARGLEGRRGVLRHGPRGDAGGVGAHVQGQHGRPAGLAEPRDLPSSGDARGHRAGVRPDGRPRHRGGGPGRVATERRSLRGRDRGAGPGRADRVGRVPLARLLPRPGRSCASLPSSTRATCSTPPPCAAWGSPTPGSGGDEPRRGRRGRRVPRIAPLRPSPRPRRQRGLPRRPLHRLQGQRRPPHGARPLHHGGEGRLRERRRRRRAGRRRVQPRFARFAPGLPGPAAGHAGRR